MPQSPTESDLAALDWVLRTRDPEFTEWEAFTSWLEADPAHGERYHMLMADADDMDALVAAVPQPVLPAPRESAWHRRRWLGGAIAAALVGVVGWQAYDGRAQPFAIETAPGERRIVPLADGSRVALNGGTRLLLDRKDGRTARLEHGEALFTIRHDAAQPFQVAVGDDRLLDIGTRFNVVRADGQTRVAVSEGAVMFNPDAEKVRLNPGQALRSVDGAGRYTLAAVDAATVGGWQTGRLEYDGAPLAEVAADIARATGTHLKVDAGIAARPFRGTILLDGLARDPSRLGPLLDVRITPRDDRWELNARP
jgi:transmembrane sensor